MNERAIFEAALEIVDLGKRNAFLDTACAGNPELRARIENLLESHESAGSFLDVPAVNQLAFGAAEPADRTQEYTPNFATPEDDQQDDNGEITLGFLQPSGKPGSLGKLGHYEILQVLGQGGFGIVLKAFDESLHRLVAIKVLSPEMAATSPPRKRFLREARAAAAIRHENIVQVYSVEEKPLPYLVMEYIAGQTLQKKLDETGPFSVPEVLHLGGQIARGLAAAHAMGLIHRDIKPGNILLEAGPEQELKITDFGLARTANDASMTRTGVVSGTPMYMAPEQALGAALDQRADLFSVGSVLYQMVSGRPPFRAETTLAVLKRVAEDTPRPIREIIPETPDWLCVIIARLHAKRPDDRIQNAKELADLLAQCQKALEQGTAPVLPLPVQDAAGDARVVPQPVPPATRANSRRFAGGLAASALAVLLLIIGLGVTEATGVTNVRGTVVQLFSPEGTLVVEVDDPGVSVSIDGEEMVITGTGVTEIRLRPGEHQVAARKGDKLVSRELVTVSRNGRRVVRISREAGAAPTLAEGQSQESGPGGRPSALLPGVGGPSPFDQLRPEDILAEDRFAWQPQELVAVLGSYRQRHTYRLSSIALSADGRWVASGSHAHEGVPEAVLWDRATMNRVATLTGVGVAFSPDSKTLACAVPGEAVHFYELTEGKPRLRLRVPNSQQVSSVAFDSSGGRLFGVNGRGLQRWRLTEEKPTELPAVTTENSVGHFGIDRDGNTAVLLEHYAYHPRGAAAAQALVWDVSQEQPRQRFSVKYDGSLDTVMLSVAISPDGKRLFTGSQVGHVHLWDISGDAPRAISVVNPAGTCSCHNLTFTPDGDSLLAGFGNFGIVRLDVSQPTATVGATLPTQFQPELLSVSPDGKVAVAGGIEQNVSLLSLEDETLKEVLAPPGHRNSILSIELARDGRTLLSTAGYDFSQVWTFDGRRFVPGAQTPNTSDIRPGLIAPGGDVVIVGSSIFRHDQGRLTPVKQLSYFPLCLSGDGRVFVDEALEVFDRAGPQAKERLRLSATKVVGAAGLNTDGSTLAVLLADDPHVTWWDLREPQPQTRQIPLDLGLADLKWTPDGQTLIAAGGEGIVAWDWNQGQPRERARREERSSRSVWRHLAMAPDGRTFATTSFEGRVIVWETATLSPLREWTVPTEIRAVQFAPDGRHLLLGYANGVIEVWRMATLSAAAGS